LVRYQWWPVHYQIVLRVGNAPSQQAPTPHHHIFKMAATPARRGVSALLSASTSKPAPLASRIAHRSFSSSRIYAAYVTAPKAAAPGTTNSSTAARPAATTSSAPRPATTSIPQRTVTPQFPAKEPPVPTSRNTTAESAAASAQKQRSLTDGLSDAPPELEGVPAIDWTRSYHGLGSISFTPEQGETLLAPITQDDVEVKPDGIIYLPEIKYRRILNKTFGPGGWGLAPRGESIVTGKLVTREYGLVVQGRYVSSSHLPHILPPNPIHIQQPFVEPQLTSSPASSP
jgi:hypothetical protein